MRLTALNETQMGRLDGVSSEVERPMDAVWPTLEATLP